MDVPNVATPKKTSKTDRVARDRVRAYEARQEVHTRIISRRKRDNLIAAIAVAGVTLFVVGAQFTHVALFPAVTPTSTATPGTETQPVPDASLSEDRTWTGTSRRQ